MNGTAALCSDTRSLMFTLRCSQKVTGISVTLSCSCLLAALREHTGFALPQGRSRFDSNSPLALLLQNCLAAGLLRCDSRPQPWQAPVKPEEIHPVHHQRLDILDC